MTRVLGIDPGGKTTGMVLRDGNTCHAVELVERGEDFGDYLMHVVWAAEALANDDIDFVAVEDVVNPSWFLDGKEAPLLNLQGLLETAQVLGAVRSHLACRLVRPDGFGKPPKNLPPTPGAFEAWYRQSYPPQLIGAREKTFKGVLRHARSAWDVAGAAEKASRQQPLFGGTS